MTKLKQKSIEAIKTTFKYMTEELLLELKRENQQRRKRIDKGFGSLQHHFEKLNIDIRHLKGKRGTYYNPERNYEYFKELIIAFLEWEKRYEK